MNNFQANFEKDNGKDNWAFDKYMTQVIIPTNIYTTQPQSLNPIMKPPKYLIKVNPSRMISHNKPLVELKMRSQFLP